MPFTVRNMAEADHAAVAALIFHSTNAWYLKHRGFAIFGDDPAVANVFVQTYSQLPGSYCQLAVDDRSGEIIGSCFVHPRATHLSLGIMNVHPDHFGKGIARVLLGQVTALADQRDMPVRLVSSAMNLDSFSLYTRAGFVPRRTYQDMFIEVPAAGLPFALPRTAERLTTRPATLDDLPAIVALERRVSGIEREDDHRHFLNNTQGFWHASVAWHGEELVGYLASSADPGCNMLGPGVAVDEDAAAAVIHAELNQQRGRRPVFLVPVECSQLVRLLYEWGARNCELHVHQVRGRCTPFAGVTLPSFLPESG